MEEKTLPISLGELTNARGVVAENMRLNAGNRDVRAIYFSPLSFLFPAPDLKRTLSTSVFVPQKKKAAAKCAKR